MSQYYSISDVCMMTGLSDRTIRNYITNGLLQGERIDRAWAFTEEQIVALVTHPSVLPSIQAKKHALITDFMLDNHKKSPQMCVLWDMPNRCGESVNEAMCKLIAEDKNLNHFQYSYDGIDGGTKLILKGEADDIIRLINAFQSYDNR